MLRPSPRLGGALVIALTIISACSGSSSPTAAPSSAPSTVAPTESMMPSESPSAAAWSPDHAITFLVGYTAGSAPDANARVIAQEMEKDLGVSIVIQNVEGAASTIALRQLADATADGYTIGYGTAGGMSLQRRLIDSPFSGLSEVTPISRTNLVSNVMYASAKRGWDTVDKFVAAAKAASQPITVGLGAAGSIQHIQSTLFAQAAGFEIRPVYFGAGQMVLPAVNGTVDVSTSQFGPTVQYVQTGDLAYICTFVPKAPAGVDVTTCADAGYDTSSSYNDYEGIFGPAGLPDEVVSRLEQSIKTAIDSDAYAQYAQKTFTIPAYLDHTEFAQLAQTTDQQAVNIIQQLGLGQ